MRLPPGLCPGPHSGEATFITILTPRAVPGRKSMALLVAGSLAGRTFLINKRNVAYINIAWPFHSHVYLIFTIFKPKILSKVGMFNTTPNLQIESKCTLQNIARTVHALTVALTVLSPPVGHGVPRPP